MQSYGCIMLYHVVSISPNSYLEIFGDNIYNRHTSMHIYYTLLYYIPNRSLSYNYSHYLQIWKNNPMISTFCWSPRPALRTAMQVAEALRAPRAPSAPCHLEAKRDFEASKSLGKWALFGFMKYNPLKFNWMVLSWQTVSCVGFWVPLGQSTDGYPWSMMNLAFRISCEWNITWNGG